METTLPRSIVQNGRFANPKEFDFALPGMFEAAKLWWSGEFQLHPPPSDQVLDETFPLTPVEWDKLKTPSASVQCTWIGHASWLIQQGGVSILTDPWFTERASMFSFAGPKRYRPPIFTTQDLVDNGVEINAVVISHSHYDHLCVSTVCELSQSFPKCVFFVPLGLKEWFLASGITEVREMDWWDDAKVSVTASVQCLPAKHWSRRGMLDTNTSLWGGWGLKFEQGQNVYFSGDTAFNQHLFESIASQGPWSVALLPIGAYEPREFMKNQHMNVDDAIRAFELLGARHGLAMHHGTISLTAEPVDEPKRLLEEAGVEHFQVVRHGEVISVVDLENEK